MPSPIINRLKKINYQISKDKDIEDFSDVQLIYMAQGIVNAVINDESQDQIVDNDMPSNMFGVDLDWSIGAENDTLVTISKGIHSINQDMLLENYRIEGYDVTLDTEYASALGIARTINNEEVPDTFYEEIDVVTTLADALTMIDNINNKEVA